jgi:Ca2+-binding RTX toxin-like protein
MATVTGNSSSSTWMELSWYWPTSDAQLAGASVASNQIAVYLTSGSKIFYNGSYNLSTATGTITSIDLYFGNSLSFTVSGISYSLSTWLNGWFDQDLPYVLSGADTINGSSGYPNYLMGYSGNDTLNGGGNNDVLDGGVGADSMNGGLGNDLYIVNDGGDTVTDTGGTDTVQSWIPYTLPTGVENLTLLGSTIYGFGNAADNVITGTDQHNSLRGDAGADTIYAGAGDDWIEGETGNFPFAGVAGNDTIYGEAGNDTVLAGQGNDLLYGGSGTDALVGEDGNDTMFGGADWDLMDGRDGADFMYGEGGADIIFGDVGADLILGGDGDDLIMGERGFDSMTGDNDQIDGEAGNDMLDGSAGDDVIYGGLGNDIIDGDHGNDVIVGGYGAEIIAGTDYNHVTGRDTFRYPIAADGGDWIYGFRAVAGDSDMIDLRFMFDLAGYAGTTPRSDGYLAIGVSGGNTHVYVDESGPAGGGNWVLLVSLYQTTLDPSQLDSYFMYQ